ncbi:histidine kinase [Oxalobacteraceae bacterium]|nr:histidine kinase [Oxalobacteraceae bacterium]
MFSKRAQLAIGAAWILFWLLMITTEVQDYLRDGGHHIWQPVLWTGSSGVAGTLLLYLQRRHTRRYDKLLGTPWRWFGHQLLWLPVYWISFVPLAFGIRHAVYRLAGDRYTHEGWPAIFLYEDVKMTVFFFVFVLILFGVLSYHAMQEEKLRAERASGAVRQAQLQQLTQQMQPHFLFNALNTISSLMHSDVDRADAMLIQLADLLRATLDASGQHEATLEAEFRLLRGYALLMSERFAERVSVEWDIDPALLAYKVPVMSLQPLLENVFKHTVERRRQPTRIHVSASREQDALVLRVEDDAGTLAAPSDAAASAPDAVSGQRGASGGIGLRNLRERLATLHGAQASLILTPLSPAGVRAEMRLPCAC